MSDPEPPFDLGKFYVLGIIGEGGTGVVYAAQLESSLVALKVLRSTITLTDREVSAFVAEAERMERVRHPSLVPVLDAGTLPDGRPYLVMPRLQGMSLSERLAKGPYAIDRALALFEGLANGVGALHEAGLIHRDIKPENIFVVAGKSEGDEERLVLLDFGIAREINAPASTTTQQGLVRGTPAYMAPERFFGAKATISTDLYELAVVLHMMLTGGLPWDPLDPKDRLSSVTADALAARLPPALAEALSHALSMGANERPASVDDLLEEVQRAAAGVRPSTAPVQITPPSGAPLRRSEIARMSSRETLAATPFPANATTAKKRRSTPRAAIAVVFAAIVCVGAVLIARELMQETTTDMAVGAPSASAAIAEDAGSPIVAASAQVSASVAVSVSTPPRAPPPPRSAAVPSAVAPPVSASAPAAAPTGSTQLTSCRKLVAIYCSPAWKATEGSTAGALCSQFTNTLKTWEATPENAHAAIDAGCASAARNAEDVLKTRQAQIDAGLEPP